MCRHQFHGECNERAVAVHRTNTRRITSMPRCPNCRGSGRIIATCPYVAIQMIHTPSSGYRSAEDTPVGDPDDHQVHYVMPWWEVPVDIVHPPQAHRVSKVHVKLANGKLGIVVDPGSVQNLTGDAWLREVALQFKQNEGQPVSQTKRQSPMHVGGVGNGTQVCQWNCTVPSSIRQQDGTYMQSVYSSPVIENSGCPAPWGSRSLEENGAIIL